MPSDINFAYQLANDSAFRDQLAYALTPLVGTILEDNGDGTYDVDTSEGDGGELIARPLDQRTYAVGDFVWCMLAFSTADSAIILGSYSPAPTTISADELHAAGSGGLRIEDDGGNLGIFVEDGGQVGIGNAAPGQALEVTGTIKADGLVFANETITLYDEGTWQPAITGSSSNPTISYTNQVGKYTKLNALVFYSARVTINTISGGGGNVRISVPFTAVNDFQSAAPGNAWTHGVDLQATTCALCAYVVQNTAYAQLRQSLDNAGVYDTQISELAAGDIICISGLFWAQ